MNINFNFYFNEDNSNESNVFPNPAKQSGDTGEEGAAQKLKAALNLRKNATSSKTPLPTSETEETNSYNYAAGYDDGYERGYDDGYYDGRSDNDYNEPEFDSKPGDKLRKALSDAALKMKLQLTAKESQKDQEEVPDEESTTESIEDQPEETDTIFEVTEEEEEDYNEAYNGNMENLDDDNEAEAENDAMEELRRALNNDNQNNNE